MLILDEPTAGLDPRGRDAILETIRTINKARGTTIILVSHSMDEVARSVDRLYVVNDGRLPFAGTPGEVFVHGDELRQIGLNVPQVTQIAQALQSPRRADGSGSLYHGGRSALRSGSAREGRRCVMLKDITLGQYFPGREHRSQVGSAHEAYFDGRLYRGAVFRQVCSQLCADDGGARHLHSALRRGLQGPVPGHEAGHLSSSP